MGFNSGFKGLIYWTEVRII